MNLGLDLPLHWKVHDGLMTVTVLYFDGCPNWELARARAEEALRLVGASEPVELHRIETFEEAERVGFAGSPTILIDGEDRFPGGGQAAMACRLYGEEHSPSVDAIVEAVKR